MFDQDASSTLLSSRPALYYVGSQSTLYKPWSFWISIAEAFYTSLVIFFLAFGKVFINFYFIGSFIHKLCEFRRKLCVIFAELFPAQELFSVLHICSTHRQQVFCYSVWCLVEINDCNSVLQANLTAPAWDCGSLELCNVLSWFWQCWYNSGYKLRPG